MYDEHKYTETNASGAPGAKRAFCLNRRTIELAGKKVDDAYYNAYICDLCNICG